MEKKIAVLVVEDSEVLRQLLVHAIESDPALEVKGIAHNGEEAVAMAAQLRPDVISMDIMMPRLSGLEAIRRIMAETPTPIVVVTAVNGGEISFQAISAGALEVVEKPADFTTPTGRHSLANIIKMIKLMSEVKVITHQPVIREAKIRSSRRDIRTMPTIIVVAASTGGPPALFQIFSLLPDNFPIPILVVQHITAGFGQGMVDWLDTAVAIKVVTARSGEIPTAGKIYFAPDDQHLLLGANGKLMLSNGLPIKGLRPCADLLFESVAKCQGRSALAIILTGMGNDGTQGLTKIREMGGTCIAQDELSSVVFGMPRVAIESGLIDLIKNPQEIAIYLKEIVTGRAVN